MSKQPSKEIHNLLNFLDAAPTAWHAVNAIQEELEKHKFQQLHEKEPWKIAPGGRYFVQRNGSSLCAFIVPKDKPTHALIAASHTDSPAFKLKPNAEFRKENMVMLGVEIYGAPMLTSWLNRDLGIAGRIVYTDKKGNICESLVRLDKHPVVIPQLAIHLDRNVNESGPVLNKQDQLAALAALTEKDDNEAYLEKLLKEQVNFKELLGADLFLFPLEKARLLGYQNQMIASYRIDSLGSVHAALQAFLASIAPSKDQLKMIVFWDNEEIGSSTAQGAGSPFFSQTLERICLVLKLSREDFFRLCKKSLCLSVDLAHALHPNYSDKHEPRHQILMSKGIVLKTSAQYRYASDANSTAFIVNLCRKHKIPFQYFVSRGDIPAGTTIGPIHAHLTGIPTVDIGMPQLSMHSSRELMAFQDYEDMCKLLNASFG